MTFNNFSLYLIRRLLIVILFFTTSQVNASVISYSDSFNTYVSASSTTDNHASNGDNDTDSIILKGFDASLGMLSSVSLSFESTWNFNALIYAEDPTPYTYLDNFGFTHTTNDTMGTLYFPFIDFQVALIDQSSIPIASTSLYNSFFSLGCEAEYIGGPDYFVSCLGD